MAIGFVKKSIEIIIYLNFSIKLFNFAVENDHLNTEYNYMKIFIQICLISIIKNK